MKVSLLFSQFDFRIGAHWDKYERRLFLVPIPMFGVEIQFKLLDE